jgi:hypothetical protein
MVVSLNRTILVVGLVLASLMRVEAQGPEHRPTYAVSARSSDVIAPFPHAELAEPTALPPDTTDVRYHAVSPISSEGERTFPGSSLLHVTNTPFMSQSRVPVAQTTGGRLQLNLFITSINNRNVMLGPNNVPDGVRPLGQPRSGDLYGIGVSVPLGRGGDSSAGSRGLLHGLSRIVRAK